MKKFMKPKEMELQMKHYLSIRKGKLTELQKLKKDIQLTFLRSSGNRIQDYISEDMSEQLYKLGWRKT